MSTILIDRRTAVLLGELAAEPTRPRSLDLTAVDGVSLGVEAAGRTAGASRRGSGSVARVAPAPTRRQSRRGKEFSPREAEVTVRRPSAGEARLRRRLRCEPRVAGSRRGAARASAPQGGRLVRPRRGSVHLTRRGRLVAVLLLLVVLTVAFSVGRVTSTALGSGAGAGNEVVVQRGDTLWSIAERIAPNADPRTTAADLMAINGLGTPSLEVGQHLRLP